MLRDAAGHDVSGDLDSSDAMKKHTFENEKIEDPMKICKILMVLEHFFFWHFRRCID